MKKTAVMLCLVCLMLSFIAPAGAYYEEYKQNIKDGIGSIVKSPQPMAESLKEEFNKSEFKPFGIIGGFLKGSYYMGKEIGWGIFRILTFNLGVE